MRQFAIPLRVYHAMQYEHDYAMRASRPDVAEVRAQSRSRTAGNVPREVEMKKPN